MATFSLVVSICAGIMTILGLVVFLVKPVREKVLKTKEREEKQNKKIEDLQEMIMASTLNDLTQIYYEAMAQGELKQYKYESFCNLYEVYLRRGGNHWSKKMHEDIQEIRVIPN